MVPEAVASAIAALLVVVVALVTSLSELRARVATERRLDATVFVTDPSIAGLAPEDLVAELVLRLRRVTQADLAVLFVRVGDRFVVREQDGAPRLDPAIALAPGEGVVGRVALEADAVLANDITADQVAIPELPGFRSFLGCPLLTAGEVAGVVAVLAERRGAFSAEHLRLGRRVAERLAHALARARSEGSERASARALAEAEHRARTLAEAPPLGILEADASGEVVRWNRTAADLLGWPRWVSGAAAPNGLPPEIVDAVATGVEGRRVEGLEVSVLRPAGGAVRLVVSAVPVTALDGSIEGAIGLLDDVSERDQMEQQLRQAQRLEAMARLAGGVAHDFNNLLTVIKGHSEVLLKTMADDEAREDVDAIRLAGDRAAELTKQLLTIGRRSSQELQVVDLHGRVRELAPVLQRLVDDIDLRVVTSPDGAWVRVEPSDFDQSLMNLVINARDVMPGGGRLVVESRAVELRARGASLAGVSPGRYVLLTVADTGPGMPREVVERCFDPFFTTKSRGKGTGLGLAIVYSTATQAGGHATVESTVGRGTTFRMWLPEVDPASAEPVPFVAARPRRRPPSEQVVRVLLVEDDAPIRSLARSTLEDAGYEVVDAASGEEALAKARAERVAVDVLISDVMLGGMTGDELAVALRKRWKGLPVVLMSGFTDRTFALEPDLFLEKPFALEEIPAAVATVVARFGLR